MNARLTNARIKNTIGCYAVERSGPNSVGRSCIQLCRFIIDAKGARVGNGTFNGGMNCNGCVGGNVASYCSVDGRVREGVSGVLDYVDESR